MRNQKHLYGLIIRAPSTICNGNICSGPTFTGFRSIGNRNRTWVNGGIERIMLKWFFILVFQCSFMFCFVFYLLFCFDFFFFVFVFTGKRRERGIKEMRMLEKKRNSRKEDHFFKNPFFLFKGHKIKFPALNVIMLLGHHASRSRIKRKRPNFCHPHEYISAKEPQMIVNQWIRFNNVRGLSWQEFSTRILRAYKFYWLTKNT